MALIKNQRKSDGNQSAKGGRREGSGRPRGALNRRTEEKVKQVEASGLTPLDYMLTILRNEAETMENRCWAAEKAAPYIHAKLANVQHQGPDGGPIVFQTIYEK